MSRDRIRVAVLGGTGAVGQRFVSLLQDHPWFEIVALTGSDRSIGQRYAEVTRWLLPEPMPEFARSMIVRPSEDPGDAELLFSALPTASAAELEPVLAAAGYVVCSNAAALRMAADVPLLIPEINPDHLALIEVQRQQRGWRGLVVTSPNCSTSGVIFPLKALHDSFGLRRAHLVTMQAISGAGYPGVPSMDILDNIIPQIGGEEEKIENEARRLLGNLQDGAVLPLAAAISAQTNRVPVSDGHFAAVSVELENRAALEEVGAALAGFAVPEEVAALPSAPSSALILRHEPDRPQPRLDREAEKGMAVTVGRLQTCKAFDYKFVCLVHNTKRGAASGSILNAELLVLRGYLSARH